MKAVGFVKRGWLMLAAGIMFAMPGVVRADIQLDMLKTRTETYTNVTVYNRTKTDIFIRHERGLANIKLVNLPPETVAQLDAGGAVPAAPAGPSDAVEPESHASETNNIAINAALFNAQMDQQVAAALALLKTASPVKITRTLLIIIASVFLFVYLFFCYCMKLICEKTGNEAGVLVWIPVLQTFPMLRAASMSGWWFLVLGIPLVSIIPSIMWCFKIVQARGKSVWAAIGLLFPLTNIISILYLAFSSGVGSEQSSGSRKVSIGPPALPSEA